MSTGRLPDDDARLARYTVDYDGDPIPLPDPPEPRRCEDCGIALARHGAECGLESWDDRAPRDAYWVR